MGDVKLAHTTPSSCPVERGNCVSSTQERRYYKLKVAGKTASDILHYDTCKLARKARYVFMRTICEDRNDALSNYITSKVDSLVGIISEGLGATAYRSLVAPLGHAVADGEIDDVQLQDASVLAAGGVSGVIGICSSSLAFMTKQDKVDRVKICVYSESVQGFTQSTLREASIRLA